MNYRTHRKILVVDGEVGFTGGAGVADHWLGNADNKEHWRDTQVEITGNRRSRLLEGAFYENFARSGRPQQHPRWIPPRLLPATTAPPWSSAAHRPAAATT